MKIPITYLIVVLLFTNCALNQKLRRYESETLKIEQVTKHVYVHTSYLQTSDFGNVPCNGMVVLDRGMALIFDTPVNDRDSEELIVWIEQTMDHQIKGVVVTHFHVDCLGGLASFHQRNIPSYASKATIRLAKEKNNTVPKKGFDESLILEAGRQMIINLFPGEGHTTDNIVCYVPQEKVLFGGCLIKALGAGKGNLADANVNTWSESVKRVKGEFDDIEIVIPGHGAYGGPELLDYTIEKFEVKNQP